MEVNKKKYDISQNGKNYILTSCIIGEYIRITCVEAGVSNPPIYFGEFSLSFLCRLSRIFETISTISEALVILNQTFESQKVTIENHGTIINVILFITREVESEDTIGVKIENNDQGQVYTQPLPEASTYIQEQQTVETNIPIETTTTQEQYIETNDNYQNYENYTVDANVYNTENYQSINLPLYENQVETQYYNNDYQYQEQTQVETMPQPEIYQQQETVETTTTTAQEYVPPPQPASVDLTIYTEKITTLESELYQVRGENDMLKNEINQLREEINQLRSQINSLLEENRILREKNTVNPNEAYIQEINRLKEENARLRQQLEEFYTIKTTYEQSRLGNEDEINYLKRQIEEYIKSQKKLEEIILLKQKQIDELKNQMEQLVKNVSVTESENYIMRQQQKEGAGSQTLTIQDTRMQRIKGDIIKSTAELEFLTRKICANHQKITLDLLYKATIDSDKASVFHNKCDWANKTLVLVKSGNGRRFGGYTTCNWKGNSIEKKDDNAFVFSLDKMQIYEIIPGEDAIGCYPKYGPVFLGCQIRIYDEFFTKGGTTFEKGLNYNTQEDYELTGGLKKFDVKEIEVYNIQLE